MGNTVGGTPLQGRVLKGKAATSRSTPVDLVLLNSDGTPFAGLDSTNVAAHQAASVAADVATLKTDFNALLTKLQTSGLMASS